MRGQAAGSLSSARSRTRSISRQRALSTLRPAQGLEQHQPRLEPVALDRAFGDAEHVRDLRLGNTSEEAQLDDVPKAGVYAVQAIECCLDREYLVQLDVHGRVVFAERD